VGGGVSVEGLITFNIKNKEKQWEEKTTTPTKCVTKKYKKLPKQKLSNV
jgi:hypothetical protein